MYCKKCGSSIDDDSVFCSNCGFNLNNSDNNSIKYDYSNEHNKLKNSSWKIFLKKLSPILITFIVFGIIALTTTPIVLNNINKAKESSNLRCVESYAKAIEYGVIQYEYKHDGDQPSTYCDVKPYVNLDHVVCGDDNNISCDITITGDGANVAVEHCKVGDYEKHSYRYDGTLKTENRGAVVEEVTEFGNPPSCY